MNLFIGLVRIVAGFVGFFVLLLSLAKISGFIPYSDETPDFYERLIASTPALIFSIVLLAPHSLFTQGLRYKFLLTSYAIVIIFCTYYAVTDIVLNYSSSMRWYIILPSVLLLLVLIANGLALRYRHNRPSLAT